MPLALNSPEAQSFLDRGFSRRQVGRIASALATGAGFSLFSEHAMAQEAQRRALGGDGMSRAFDPDAVRITSNENPLGPCKEGLEAIVKVAPYGGRYQPFGESADFVKAIAETEGVKPDFVAPFAGSSDPLFRSTCAFTSPTKSWVMANPGYGGGAPQFIGSKVHRITLREDYSHDVEAMMKADPDAGVYYVCNPNNPSGTVTARKDIEYLLANKKKDAVVVVDEAYIHFSDSAQPCNDLVAAEKDVVVLRTFSKAYGMAGIRAGFALARPDLLAKMRPYGGGMLPVTGMACATASLRSKGLVAERRAYNKSARELTFEYMQKKGVKFIPSETNFFMMETGKPGAEMVQSLAKHKVYIGRVWPVWPTKVRVSVGTTDDMQKFCAAMTKVLDA